jgi:hypothetical protein
VYATLPAPSTQARARLVDDLVVEAFSDETVVSERLQLGGAMGAASSAWDESLEIDRLICTALAFADHARNRASAGLVAHLLDFLEEIKELRERYLAPASGGGDCRDLAAIEPSFERRLADPEQAGSLGRADRLAGEVLEELENGRDLSPQLRIGNPGGTSQPQDVLESFSCVRSLSRHTPTIA